MIVYVMLSAFIVSFLMFAILSFFKSKRAKVTSVICLLLAIASAVTTLSILFKQEASDKTEVVEEQTFIEDVGFDEIYVAYKENELRADDTYKNNRYRITAKVNGMSTGGLFNLTGGATLTMEKKVGNTIVFFYAEFEKEQEDNLRQINVGDTITFEGECLSAGTWTECELITD